MKIKDVIAYVDSVKPNAFDQTAKLIWLNEVEGLVQTEVMLIAAADLIEYDPETDPETELLVKTPHDKIYRAYLTAMIDYANGEYNRYANTVEQFNTWFSEYVIWYADKYRPADGGMVDRGYYLSAYGIAVKRGYAGTEEEWLASLKGERGLQGVEGPRGPQGIPGKLQSLVVTFEPHVDPETGAEMKDMRKPSHSVEEIKAAADAGYVVWAEMDGVRVPLISVSALGSVNAAFFGGTTGGLEGLTERLIFVTDNAGELAVTWFDNAEKDPTVPEWAKREMSPVMIVTTEKTGENTGTASHGASEIQAHVDTGGMAWLVYENVYMPYWYGMPDTAVLFHATTVAYSELLPYARSISAMVDQDKNVIVSAVDVRDDVLVVRITYSNGELYASYGADEIKAHTESGGTAILQYEGLHIPFVGIQDMAAVFSLVTDVFVGGGELYTMTLKVAADSKVTQAVIGLAPKTRVVTLDRASGKASMAGFEIVSLLTDPDTGEPDKNTVVMVDLSTGRRSTDVYIKDDSTAVFVFGGYAGGDKKLTAVRETVVEVGSGGACVITERESNWLDANQGAENAGKALVIGADGSVVPGEVQGGGGDHPLYLCRLSTTSPFTLDRTYAEVAAASAAGYAVAAMWGKYMFTLRTLSETAAQFACVDLELRGYGVTLLTFNLPADSQEVGNIYAKVPFAGSTTGGVVCAEPATEADTIPARLGEDGRLYVAPADLSDAVKYTPEERTEAEQMQARANLGLYHKSYDYPLVYSDVSWGGQDWLNYAVPDSLPNTARIVVDGIGEFATELQKTKYRIPNVGEQELKWHGNSNLLKNDSLINKDFAIDEQKYADLPFVVYRCSGDLYSTRGGIYLAEGVTMVKYDEFKVYDTANPVETYETIPTEYLPPAPVTSVNGQTGDVKLGMVVTITDNGDGTLAASHIASEIIAHVEAGGTAVAEYNGYTMLYYGADEGAAVFIVDMIITSQVQRESLFVTEDGVAIHYNDTYTPPAPSPMTGATATAAGAPGLVPAPAAGEQDMVLHGDGTWREAAAGGADISLGVTSAEVGDILRVSAVDDNGMPTAWEAVGFETGLSTPPLLADVTFAEDVTNPDVDLSSVVKRWILIDFYNNSTDTAIGESYPRINNGICDMYISDIKPQGHQLLRVELLSGGHIKVEWVETAKGVWDGTQKTVVGKGALFYNSSYVEGLTSIGRNGTFVAGSRIRAWGE